MIIIDDTTIIIPVRIDNGDRLRNLRLVIDYISSLFDIPFFIYECDSTSNIPKDILERRNVHHIFSQTDDILFHRTKYINKSVKQCRTRFFGIYDSDVLLPPLQYVRTLQALRNNEADVVYPYDGRFLNIPPKDIPIIADRLTIDFVQESDCSPGLGMPELSPDRQSFGGAVFFSREKFIHGGMANEHLVSYSPDDAEIAYRFRELGYRMHRVHGPLFHLTHERGLNSSEQHPLFQKNHEEFRKVFSLKKHELRKYVNTWKWCKPTNPLQSGKKCIALVFSKDRALQLDATLRSFFLHCRDSKTVEMRILYKATTPLHMSQYHKLMDEYANIPAIRFVREQNFKTDMISFLSLGEYLFLIVDDTMFVRDFCLGDAASVLASCQEILGVSFRLGKNTTYCYSLDKQQPLPGFSQLEHGMIKYNWTDAQYDFGYPLEVSSSLYRTSDLFHLIKLLPFQNPNTLEGQMNANKTSFRNTRPFLVCYEHSAAFCIPLNIVQTVCPNRSNADVIHSPENLASLFEEGYRFDASHYSGFTPNACHQEVEMKLTPSFAGKAGETLTVSVIIPCYNQAHYLPEAVESVVSQTYGSWECIIVNDGSPDNTNEVAHALIAKYSDKNIILLEKPNSGLADARNFGIRNARGKYILPLDADDKIAPEALSASISALTESSHAHFVYTDVQEFGEGQEYQVKRHTDLAEIKYQNHWAYCTMFSKTIWEKAGGYKPCMVLGAEDWEFWINLLKQGCHGVIINKPLFLYRVRSGSMVDETEAHIDTVRAQLRILHPEIYPETEVKQARQRIWSADILFRARIERQVQKTAEDHFVELFRSLLLTEPSEDSSVDEFPATILPQKRGVHPKISVVLPTRDREDLLKRCLEGLVNQTIPKDDFEVVITDDGSDPLAWDMVKGFLGKLNIKYSYQDSEGPSVARNASILRAAAPLLVLHDDDDVAEADYLERCLDFHTHYPDENEILLTRIAPHPDLLNTPLLEWIFDAENGIIGFPDPGLVHGFWKFYSGASSCKQSLFRYGLFSPEYRQFEDMELALRLNNHTTLNVYYDPEAVKYLMRQPDFRGLFIRSYREGRSYYKFHNEYGDITLEAIGSSVLNSEETMTALSVSITEMLKFLSEYECFGYSIPDRACFEYKGVTYRGIDALKICYSACVTYARAKGWSDHKNNLEEDEGNSHISRLLEYYHPKPLETDSSSTIQEKRKGYRTLIFFPHNPYPPRSGAHQRCLSVMSALRDLGHEVTLFSSNLYTDNLWDTKSVDNLRQRYGCRVEIYGGTQSDHKYISLAKAENQELVNWAMFSPPGLLNKFIQTFDRLTPDTVLINYAMWGSLVNTRSFESAVKIIETHDLVTLNTQMRHILLQYLGQPPYDPTRVSPEVTDEDFFLNAQLSATDDEYAIYDRFDYTIAISSAEAETIRTRTHFTHVEHLPMTFSVPQPHNTYAGSPLFVAGPNPFNLQGYLYFTRKVLPLILFQSPSFMLDVVGSSCEQLVSVPGVQLKGFSPHLATLYTSAPFAICPLIGGTGVQVKIVEAMAHGVPVIALKNVAHNSPIHHGVNGFIAEDADDFIEYSLHLYKDRDLCRKFGLAARETIENDFSPVVLTERLRDIFDHAGKLKQPSAIRREPSRSKLQNSSPDIIKSILWIRTDAIGDNVIASSMLPHIKAKYKDTRITVCCQDHVAEIYEVCPFIDDIVPFNRRRSLDESRHRDAIADRLRRISPDLTLNSVYSREPLNDYFALSSNAKITIAFNGDLCNITGEERDKNNRYYTRLCPDIGARAPEFERLRIFLNEIHIEAPRLEPVVWLTPEDETFAEEFFQENKLETEKTIALFAGVQQDTRLYKHYGNALSRICREYGIHVIALGAAKDRETNQRNLDDIGTSTINLSGNTTLRQSAALIKQCRLAIGAETGLAHISCAVGTPNVILLGGGFFGRFMPYSSLTSVVCLPLECYGCCWKCRYRRAHCVCDILPEVMAEAIQKTFDTSSNQPRIFVQGASLWNPQHGEPSWKSFEESADTGACQIIPVEVVPEELTDTSDTAMPIYQPGGKNTIRVSAIVSTYNSERFLRGCLEDLLQQSLYSENSLEIIVIDSASEQNERAIVEDFQQRYHDIVYIRTEERETVYAAWNRGIHAAKGIYITNANTDDRHRHDALKVMSEILDENPEIGLVYADVIVTENENETFDRHIQSKTYQWADYRRESLSCYNYIGPQPMWRKSLHMQYGYFDETFVVSGDWEFWLRVAEGTDFYHIPDFLGLYLFSAESIEHRNSEQKKKENKKIHQTYIPQYFPTYERYFEDFLKVNPAAQNVIYWFGLVLTSLEQYDRAMDLFATYLDNFPDNPLISEQLNEVLHHVANREIPE